MLAARALWFPTYAWPVGDDVVLAVDRRRGVSSSLVVSSSLPFSLSLFLSFSLSLSLSPSLARSRSLSRSLSNSKLDVRALSEVLADDVASQAVPGVLGFDGAERWTRQPGANAMAKARRREGGAPVRARGARRGARRTDRLHFTAPSRRWAKAEWWWPFRGATQRVRIALRDAAVWLPLRGATRRVRIALRNKRRLGSPMTTPSRRERLRYARRDDTRPLNTREPNNDPKQRNEQYQPQPPQTGQGRDP